MRETPNGFLERDETREEAAERGPVDGGFFHGFDLLE